MDRVTLLKVAHAAGLTVEIRGDSLRVRGKRAADGILPDDRFCDVQASQPAGTWNECWAVLGNFQRDLRRIIRRAGKSCPSLPGPDGKKTVSIHDFRRSAVTNWSRVANIQTTMALAGHSNMQTTKRYYASVTADQIEMARQASTIAIERRPNPAQGPQSDPS